MCKMIFDLLGCNVTTNMFLLSKCYHVILCVINETLMCTKIISGHDKPYNTVRMLYCMQMGNPKYYQTVIKTTATTNPVV